jgi:hypothetical protein
LQSVVAAKSLIVIDAIVLHVLGDGTGLRPDKCGRYSDATKHQGNSGWQACAITGHPESLLNWRLLVARFSQAGPPKMLRAIILIFEEDSIVG